MNPANEAVRKAARRRFLEGRAAKLWIIWLLVLVIVIAAIVLPPLREPRFLWELTDDRTILGVPNFWNVVSNAPLLLVGAWGLFFLWHRASQSQAFIDDKEKWPYFTLFLSVALTFFGSSYYHFNPDSARLLWDRLPISLGFMSLVSVVVSERISVKAGLLFLAPLLLIGAGTVVYWRWSELHGAENLMPYALMQYGSMVLIVVITFLFRCRYTRGRDILVVLAIYGAAKTAEVFDARIYELVHIVSGHTLKHLIAAVAVWWFLRMLQLRSPHQIMRSDLAG